MEKQIDVKPQFLAAMCHEIRTPLNGLISMADLLKTTGLNHDQSEYVDIIIVSSKALLDLTNNIMDYSEMESKNIKLELNPFLLKSCIEETFNVLYYNSRIMRVVIISNSSCASINSTIVIALKRKNKIPDSSPR